MATPQKYIEGIGRRKTASARVRIVKSAESRVIVNDRPIAEYFYATALQKNILDVLETENAGIDTYEISAKVFGGGLSSQSDAIKLGIARALVKEKADRRITLKRAGLLKRDPRAVERKKFGLKKARRRPQWSKR
ncbi:MAG: 30S ribosomal protein S9 [Candidatus Pacebacteria bacterium]|nr:30S ribosomal protein S9 [Candidatus Paceibacterota bacterium]MCF7857074.1 30S ribosomal protein S9 [Candidatus Paceibacterota bacterium]